MTTSLYLLVVPGLFFASAGTAWSNATLPVANGGGSMPWSMPLDTLRLQSLSSQPQARSVPGAPLALGSVQQTTPVAQDPATKEAALRLDRATRRLIQQGLRSVGFDPGPPDGLFGSRTRAAIQRWQAAHGLSSTGYLDNASVAVLRAAAFPPESASVDPDLLSPPLANSVQPASTKPGGYSVAAMLARSWRTRQVLLANSHPTFLRTSTWYAPSDRSLNGTMKVLSKRCTRSPRY